MPVGEQPSYTPSSPDNVHKLSDDN